MEALVVSSCSRAAFICPCSQSISSGWSGLVQSWGKLGDCGIGEGILVSSGVFGMVGRRQ